MTAIRWRIEDSFYEHVLKCHNVINMVIINESTKIKDILTAE